MTKYFLKTMVFVVSVAVTGSASAALSVFACEPEWGSLAQTLGGANVDVFTATSALQDPHRIEAKPSLVAKMRRADLVVCTGAELEIGWLPMLLRQSGNAKVTEGSPGYFAAAETVGRLDVPDHVDRSMGDVHAAGNPHVFLDPRRIAKIAAALHDKFAALDHDHAADYQKLFDSFQTRWQQEQLKWEQAAAPLRNLRVVVHHQDSRYLFDWLGVTVAGSLEPKPGVPPSAGYLAELKTQLEKSPAKMIVRAAYQEGRPAKWLAEKTGMKIVVLPFTVGGDSKATDLFALFDDTVQLLVAAAK